MVFPEAYVRNGMVTLDGYSKYKQLKRALRDLNTEIAKFNPNEVLDEDCLDAYVEDLNKGGYPNVCGEWYLEAQQVDDAVHKTYLNGDEEDESEENVVMEYDEGHWYLCIRFCAA